MVILTKYLSNHPTMEAQILLRNPEIFPSEEVLKNALGESVYNLMKVLIVSITGEEYNLSIEWKYYNDGRAWFGKVVHKKKTVFWLSVWEGFFKAGFYFTEKHIEAIAALDISEKIKEEFCKAKLIGKLIPMIFAVNKEEQLADLMAVISFKKSLK